MSNDVGQFRQLVRRGTICGGAAVAVAVWCGFGAAAQTTVTGSATATITDGIRISADQILHFGDIIPQNGGFVTVDPTTGAASTQGTLIVIGGNRQGTFTVTGEAGRAYDITLPSQKVSLSNGSDTIDVDKFTSDPSGSGTLGPTGSQTLNIGARAKINNNQGFGWYSGTYQVIVAHQ